MPFIKTLFLLLAFSLPVMAKVTPPPLSPAQVLAYDSRISQEERTYTAQLLLTVGGTMAGASFLMQDNNAKRSALSFGVTSLALGAITSLYRPAVEVYAAQYQAHPEQDTKAFLIKLQEEYRLTRYVLGGSVIGLGLLSLPKGDMTDSEHNDLMIYWRAAMFGLGIATIIFPTPAEARYQETLQKSGLYFFAAPSQAGFVVGFGG